MVTLTGSAFDDELFGTAGNDVISGEGGRDTLDGGAGFLDLLLGGEGDDFLTDPDGVAKADAGAGNDTIDIALAPDWRGDSGNRGPDLIGGDGDDRIVAVLLNGSLTMEIRGDLTDLPSGGGNDWISVGGVYGRIIAPLGGGADLFEGGDFADQVPGGDGRDTIFGNGGDDSLAGGRDDDLIFGGAGNDDIGGGGERDTVFGGEGDDLLRGDGRDDFVLGGGGADAIDGNDGFLDTLVGGEGDDDITDADGAGLVDGGAGADRITLHFAAGWDNDDFSGSLSIFNGVYGSAGDDTINIDGDYGTAYGWLGQGDDNFTGGLGRDLVNGGKGIDFIVGNGGSDTIDGEGNVDLLIGGSAGDLVIGQAGADTIWGDQFTLDEDPWLALPHDGDGNDTLLGGQGNDQIITSGGDDLAYGGAGADTLWAVAGNDRLFGDAGNDSLYAGDDHASWTTLAGGDGFDFLYAGKGQTTLVGGNEFDTYYVGLGDGPVTIIDTNEDGEGNGLSLYWGGGPGPYQRLSPDDIEMDDNEDGTYTLKFSEGTGAVTFDPNATDILNVNDVGADLVPFSSDDHVYALLWNGSLYEPFT